MPTPFYVVSGFLGAGKTTLINNLLESAPDHVRIMVLVNEFGRISIDKKIIKADPSHVVDLSGGCICCGMMTELIASLGFALNEFRADVILIESTGLALPQEIARQVLSPVFEGSVERGGIITVVDAGSLLTDDFPIIGVQLKEANIAVLNKIDLIDPDALAKIRARLKEMTTPECCLVETCYGRISYHDLITRHDDHPEIVHPPTQPQGFDSTAGFANVCLVRSAPIRIEELLAFYREHRDQVVRSKGFVITERGGVEVQLSKGGIEVKEIQGPIQGTELVLIVKEEDKELIETEIKKVFE